MKSTSFGELSGESAFASLHPLFDNSRDRFHRQHFQLFSQRFHHTRDDRAAVAALGRLARPIQLSRLGRTAEKLFGSVVRTGNFQVDHECKEFIHFCESVDLVGEAFVVLCVSRAGRLDAFPAVWGTEVFDSRI